MAVAALACADEDRIGWESGAREGTAGTSEVPAPEPSAQPEGGGSPSGIAWDEDTSPGHIAPGDVLGQQALALLADNCERCHDNTKPTAIGWINDLARLIERGWLVPASSATSPIFEVLRDGHPPVPGVYILPVSAGAVEMFARFVDTLAVDAPDCAALPFVSMDQAFGAMAADAAALPAASRPFTRYVGLTYASNAGLCGAALERQRRALFEAVNGASMAESIVVPRAIDADGLLYRIDIRDYAWVRGIDLEDDGQMDFVDGWRAISAAAGPYAQSYAGPDAEALNAETETPVPFLPAHALVHAVAGGDLYYALLGVPRDMEAHRLALGVGIHPMLVEPAGRVKWAGVLGPGRREAEVVRVPQGRPERAYWVIQEQYTDDSESILDSPFGDSSRYPYQTLFGLPNGMLGYVIEQEDGTRATSVASHGCAECETSIGLAGCSACHAAGIGAVRDQVRDFVQANDRSFDSGTVEDVMANYPPAAELDALIQTDNSLHHAALEQAGVPLGGRDPLSRVYYQFELDALGARRAAGELGVSLASLEAALGRLGPELAPLRDGGSIDRAAFTAAYPGALCTLHANADHRPSRCP